MIKKIIVGGLILTTISCANKDLSQLVTECNYPDAPETKAPLWVCGAKVEGIYAGSVGVTQKSKAGVNFMLQQASANARVILAQRINSDINSNVKNYTKVATIGDEEQIDLINSVTSDVITKQRVVGAKIVKQIVSPNGALYVLVGFEDKTIYEDLLKNALKDSYNQKTTEWNAIKGDNTFEDVEQNVVTNLGS